MPNGRCRMHSGGALAGMASPTFKTGRYSKLLPERMLARYEEAKDDPELLELRNEIGVLDARLADVLKRVDTGESGRLWARLRETYEALREAQATGDADKARDHARRLGQLIESGSSDWAAWAEVRSLIDQRRRTVESERKRLVEMQQMITQERAMVLMTAVVDVIRRNVSDRGALAAISADLRALMAHEPR